MRPLSMQQLLHFPIVPVEGSPHGEGVMVQTWLVFIPQLPSLPSSLRVLVWRRMRAAGAVSLQQGVWVLPQTPEHEQFLRDVLQEAQQQGGNGILMAAAPLDAEQVAEVIERFRIDRDQEYQEFEAKCRDFLAEIAKETTACNFTFAALEENEHDLQKLHTWMEKICARDFFSALHARIAADALTACENALHSFAEAIYAREGLRRHAEDECGT